ncbi:hypothetical protein D3C81_2059450 [compost metagenome]
MYSLIRGYHHTQVCRLPDDDALMRLKHVNNRKLFCGYTQATQTDIAKLPQ